MRELVVNGVVYKIPIDTMPVAASFFVPTLFPDRAKTAIAKLVEKEGTKKQYRTYTSVHGLLLGVRVWRVA